MDLDERLAYLTSGLKRDVERWRRRTLLFEARIARVLELRAEEAAGKVEADKIVRELAENVERLAGKKLFTKEQLAEVAQEIEAPTAPRFNLGEHVALAFSNTVIKMATPDFVPPPSYKNIIEAIRTLQHAAWENSKAHGWNEAVDNPASALMMITREVSELAEEERDANSGESTKVPGFSKKEEEAADIAIRLLSYCGARNMRLGAAICAKHEFNKTRPYRHGDKLF